MNDTYHRMHERYQTGQIPWDDPLPPPEIQTLAAQLPPGRALDLGCGYGRAAIYLAARGWHVDAIDFIPQAITVAQERAAAAGVQPHFHIAPITELDFLPGPYDLAVDVGCGHALERPELQRYHQQLQRLLRPGALYVIYARLRQEDDPPDPNGPRGIPEAWLHDVFSEGFTLEKVEHGLTVMPDNAWRSAWFWWKRGRDADDADEPDFGGFSS